MFFVFLMLQIRRIPDFQETGRTDFPDPDPSGPPDAPGGPALLDQVQPYHSE